MTDARAMTLVAGVEFLMWLAECANVLHVDDPRKIAEVRLERETRQAAAGAAQGSRPQHFQARDAARHHQMRGHRDSLSHSVG